MIKSGLLNADRAWGHGRVTEETSPGTEILWGSLSAVVLGWRRLSQQTASPSRILDFSCFPGSFLEPDPLLSYEKVASILTTSHSTVLSFPLHQHTSHKNTVSLWKPYLWSFWSNSCRPCSNDPSSGVLTRLPELLPF